MLRTVLGASLVLILSSLAFGQSLKINGSTTVNPIMVDAAQHFEKKGWRILIDTQGGSSGGLSYVADGLCDIGMISRSLTDDDRKKFPKADLRAHGIGYDGVALVVSRQLYEAGVKALSKQQIQELYEGRIKNWRGVGGPDRPVVFFNKEPGRGTWEVFANFLYGDAKKAPKVFHPEVGANQEARTKVASHPGAITQLSASWAWESPDVRALGIRDTSGAVIEANLSNIKSGLYPLRRPLLLITRGEPQGPGRTLIDYVKSKEGQLILNKHGYLSLTEGAG